MRDDREVRMFPDGVIDMPSSKSVAHRAIICASLAEGESNLGGIDMSQDIEATIRCISTLGCEVCVGEPLTVKGGMRAQKALLDCGESGTTLRFLIPIAALGDDEITFTGQGHLMQRPMKPFMEALSRNGLRYVEQANTLTTKGPLKHGVFEIPGDISSQFVSGLLLALPQLKDESEIQLTTPLQSASYVELTIDTMKRFGVEVRRNGERGFTVAPQQYKPANMAIEADYSQAAFFLVAGALGCVCECRGLAADSVQGDRQIIEILRRSGVRIETTRQNGLIASAEKLLAQTVDVSDIPDLVPPLAVLFALCEGESHIIGAERLRHKESDRLATVSAALNALGAQVVVKNDSLVIHGVKALNGGRMESGSDHRIAMMGAIAAIRSRHPVWIEGSDCVAKSYPHFWRDFEKKMKKG